MTVTTAERGGTTTDRGGAPLAIARWLLAVAALVALIVVIGGITRLTESGLSITEWKPVTGALPPLSEAEWQAEFAAYQRIPQYIQINGPAVAALQWMFLDNWASQKEGDIPARDYFPKLSQAAG